MKLSLIFITLMALFNLSNTTLADDYTLSKTKELPQATPKRLVNLLETKGFVISREKEVSLRLWMRKEIPTVAKFKPSYSVQYPFATGELVGMLQVPKGKTYSDFRQQELKAGLYTLRYGHIPQDGNHLGASDISDFLIALPVAFDKSTKRMQKPKQLAQQSSKGIETNHPAIFSLTEVDKKNQNKSAKLKHDSDHEFWILKFSTTIKKVSQKKSVTLQIPINLIVIGFAEE